MRNNMDESDVEDFDEFLEENWGKHETARKENETTTEVLAKKRGRKPRTM